MDSRNFKRYQPARRDAVAAILERHVSLAILLVAITTILIIVALGVMNLAASDQGPTVISEAYEGLQFLRSRRFHL